MKTWSFTIESCCQTSFIGIDATTEDSTTELTATSSSHPLLKPAGGVTLAFIDAQFDTTTAWYFT